MPNDQALPIDTATQTQIDWALALVGASESDPNGGKGDEVLKLKQDMIEAAWKVIDGSVGEIRLGQEFTAEVARGGLLGFLGMTRDVKSIDESGDPNKEVDTGRDVEKMKSLPSDTLVALMNAQKIISGEVDKLRAAKNPASKKKLFTDSEIAGEIWAPLMRRNIIPENAIPDRYSETVQTFNAASEEYNQRLELYTETLGKFDEFAEKLGLGKETVNSLSEAGKSLMTMINVLKPGAIPDFDQGIKIFAAVQTGTSGLFDIGAILAKDGLTLDSAQKIAKVVVGAATASITAGFESKFPGDGNSDELGRELGTAINAGLNLGLSSASFALNMAQGKTDDAMMELANSVSNCCACVDQSQSFNRNEINDSKLTNIGAEAAIAIKGFAGTMLMIFQGQAKPTDIGKLVSAIGADVMDLVGSLRQEGFDNEVDEKHDSGKINQGQVSQEKSDYTEGVDAAKTAFDNLGLGGLMQLAQTRSTKDLKKLFEDSEFLEGKDKIQKMMLEMAEQRDKEVEEAGLDLKADPEGLKEIDSFNKLLAGGDDFDKELDGIERLILELKKDQMLVSVAESILKIGPAAVAAIFPPATIAVSATNMMLSMRKAVLHFQAWREWEANADDARSARTVQVEAMANRAGLSGGKTVDESINVLSGAVQVIGGAMGTFGGPVAPIGIALEKGAKLASSIKEVVDNFKDQKKLRDTWADYQKALDRPQDRSALRKAIRTNATLAKYVIAYGAVIDGNPVAKNALRKCGISAKTLQAEGANTKNVVTYLETLYADDPQVMMAVGEPAPWYPGPVVLSAESVSTFIFAMKDAKPALEKPFPPTVVNNLGKADKAREVVKKAREHLQKLPKDAQEKKVTEAGVALGEALETLRGLLALIHADCAYFPAASTSKKPQPDVLAYSRALGRIARSQLTAVEKEAELYEGLEEA